MNETMEWTFPLPRVHTGIPLGNGRLGVLLWGGGSVEADVDTLVITLARNDFWDRRSSKEWTPAMNYADIRKHLEAKDEPALRAIFYKEIPPGFPRRPNVLPVGRFYVRFPGMRIERGILHLPTAQARIVMVDADGTRHEALIDLNVDEPVLWVRLPGEQVEVKPTPSWDLCGDYLQSIGFEAPTRLTGNDAGWVQTRPTEGAPAPQSMPLACASRQNGRDLMIACMYGANVADASDAVSSAINGMESVGRDGMLDRNAEWWDDIWQRVPRLEVPNAIMQEAYDYGIYKFAAMTNPTGVAASLQGVWYEDHKMPPWSGDYHFNINVQMCYWPAYRGNLVHHLEPLWKLIDGWTDLLRQNAKNFIGIDDGLMLPHAVTDNCGIVGAFWTGTIDHGCTAWVAKMMYDAAMYTQDDELLGNRALPMMRGAMSVFQAMLEKDADGNYRLPVSVSPEYRGAAMHAWGADASFQLACIHWLCESLSAACDRLGLEKDPAWADIAAHTPLACMYGDEGAEQIALWDGTILEMSHRHHSHLAGLYPFDVIPQDEGDWPAMIARSAGHWAMQGMGQWTGWCMPWAAILHSRMGHRDMAELTLELAMRVFMNEGRGTLHNGDFLGFSRIAYPATDGPRDNEVMQMDAGMGACAAVMEMLLQSRRGVHHFFAGAPRHWKNASFEGIRAEGGVLVSAVMRDGVVREITLSADNPATFIFANPMAEGRIDTVELVEGEVMRLGA